jgi:hypothetical protein
MKPLIVIVALLTLLKPVLPVVDYVWNYDYIVNQLCENKAKPQLHCNGTCHLKKELAKANENESAAKDQLIKQSFELIFFQETAPQWFPFLETPVFVMNSHYTIHYCYTPLHPVFHPPAVV